MKFPKLIEVSRTEGIQIDGEEFTYPVADGSVVVTVSGDDVPSVTLTLLAERVTVDNQGKWFKPNEGESE